MEKDVFQGGRKYAEGIVQFLRTLLSCANITEKFCFQLIPPIILHLEGTYLVNQTLRCVFLKYHAVVYQHYTIAEVLCFLDVMRGEQDCLALFMPGPKKFPYIPPGVWVNSHGRLIEKEILRIVDPVSYTHLDVYKRQEYNLLYNADFDGEDHWYDYSEYCNKFLKEDSKQKEQLGQETLKDWVAAEINTSKMCIRDRSWMKP